MAKIKPTSKLSKNHDQKLVKTDPLLHTEKPHRKWYKPENLGKQRRKPKQRIKE